MWFMSNVEKNLFKHKPVVQIISSLSLLSGAESFCSDKLHSDSAQGEVVSFCYLSSEGILVL